MLAIVKNVVKRLAGLAGKHRWPGNKPYLLILAYHRVLPKHDDRYPLEQPMMVVTPETLDLNLQWAARHFKFIHLSQWIELCQDNNPPKGKYCALTFDDGWIDNMEYALPILKKHNAPATIYCVSGMLENKTNYWPGRATSLVLKVAEQFNDTPIIDLPALSWLKKACANKLPINWNSLDTEDYSNIIENLKVYEDLQINSFIDESIASLELNNNDNRQVLSVNELKSMMNSNLIEIGSHTINHIRFNNETSPDILAAEIKTSKKQLEDTLGTKVSTFCYPNGYHPENSVDMARQQYSGACTLEKGWNTPLTDFAKLRRVSMHEQIANNYHHFNARLSGWI